MKPKGTGTMIRLRLALVTGAMLLLYALAASAEPILAPHKYSGPIPQNALSLRIGVLGGATNQEMIDYLDGRVHDPFQVTSQDFKTSLAVDVNYIHKPHPQFGFRLNGSATALKYTSSGDFVPQVQADSLLPQLKYNREFKVDLFTVEASGIYFFSDASLKEFQPYLGAGFSLGFPYQHFTESRTDTDAIPGRPSDVSQWSVAPGAHLVGGLLYYFTDRWGMSAEGRVQLMESRFDKLQAYDPDLAEYQNVSFVVKYTGFYMSLGATYGF
jgi:hypothetical protein